MKIKISRDNYELFFLDYFEGTLSNDETKELMQFLEVHSDLKDEFEGFQNITIIEEENEVLFSEKESLKKQEIVAFATINEGNYSDIFIAFHEDDLNDNEKNDVHTFLALNPTLTIEFELFEKAKLEPDLQIEFVGKEHLKKKLILFTPKYLLRFAASFVAVAFIAFAGYYSLDIVQQGNTITAGVSEMKKNPVRPLSEETMNIIEHDNHGFSPNSGEYYKDNADFRISENIKFSQMTTSDIQEIKGANAGIFHREIEIQSEYSDIWKIRNEKFQYYRENENSSTQNKEPRIFSNVMESINGNKEALSEKISDFNAWQLASYGVKGFNLLTDNDIDFHMKSNDEGKITKLAFNDFAIPVSRDR